MIAIHKKGKTFFTSLPFLLSGLGLVVVVFLNFSMYIFLALQFFTLFLLFYLAYKQKHGQERMLFLKIIKIGFIAGIFATAGYDLIRLLIVTIFHFKIRPFDTFKFFGQIIMSRPVSDNTAYTVGFMYHLLNGITFGIAYFILFNGKHWVYGIVWAFVLELMMLCVYPRFLNLQSVMEEFTIVSCSGHTVYGSILGFINFYYFKKLK